MRHHNHDVVREHAPLLGVIITLLSACEMGTLRDDIDCNQFGNCPLAPVQISAGVSHTCALYNNGTISCWGNNNHGQLGNSNTSSNYSSTPVNVDGLLDRAIAVASGGYHTCALLADTTVMCWGDNEAGQTGTIANDSQRTPILVSNLSTVSAIAAGYFHNCALLQDGTVKCWGQGGLGELGNGATNDSNTPVAVTNLSYVMAITAHLGNHTCALTNMHGVKCWGLAEYGQLGDGRTLTPDDIAATPVTVSGLSSGVAAITAGIVHTCALLNSNGLKCWGNNDSGQLGNSSTTTSSTPLTIISSDVLRVNAGSFNTFAWIDNTLKCWGANGYGQLGDNTTINRSYPVAVQATSEEIIDITGGNQHTCAILASGVIQCWGDNSSGQLGDW
ncbi:MAG: hypothetical protein JW841_06695 [Deltaproteobacteria bacterium]|nr:hypothetical protein [Deltaproteobacteria bacterium]